MPIVQRLNPQTGQNEYFDTDSQQVVNYPGNQGYDPVNRTNPFDVLRDRVANEGQKQMTTEEMLADYFRNIGKTNTGNTSGGNYNLENSVDTPTPVRKQDGSWQDYYGDILDNNSNYPTPKVPTTLEEVDMMRKNNQLSLEDADKYELAIGNEGQYKGTAIGPQGDDRPWYERIPPINTAGSDLSTELFSLGMNIGKERGTPGRRLGIISSAGAAILGGGRDLLSGLGYQRANNYAEDWYNKNKKRNLYTADDQFTDNNYLGGLPTGRDGGVFYAEDGGSLGDPPPPEGMQENPDYAKHLALMQQWNNGYRNDDTYKTELSGPALDKYYNELKKNEGENAFIPSKVYTNSTGTSFYPVYPEPQKYVQAAQQPTSAPENNADGWRAATTISLKKKDGSTETVYVPFGTKLPKTGYSYDKFVQEMGPIGDYNKVPQGTNTNSQAGLITPVAFPEDYGNGHPQMTYARTLREMKLKELQKKAQTVAPKMRNGGEFTKTVGDYHEFMYGGKKVSGTIKKIENGKIYM